MSKKISELTDGSGLQDGDSLPVARAGANVRVTGAEIRAAAQASGTFDVAKDFGGTPASADCGPAIASAIAAAGVVGGTVLLPPGNLTCLTAPMPTTPTGKPVFIQGAGPSGNHYGNRDGTTLSFPTDLGAGVYAFDASNPWHIGGMAGFTLEAPNTAPALGAQVFQCMGIRFGGIVLEDITVIGGWLAGIVCYANHASLTRVKSGTGNYYGLYYGATKNGNGDNRYIACDFTGASYSSVGVHPNNECSGEDFYGTHFGFAPYGFIKESPAGTDAGFIQNCDFVKSPVEAFGNAAYCDLSGTGIIDTVRARLSTPTFDATYTLVSDGGLRRGWLDCQNVKDTEFDLGDLSLFPQYGAGTVAHIYSGAAPSGIVLKGSGFGTTGAAWIGTGSTAAYNAEWTDTIRRMHGRPWFPNSAVTVGQVCEIVNSGGFPKIQTAVSGSGKPLAGVALQTQTTKHVMCADSGICSGSSYSVTADSAVTAGDKVTCDGVTTAGRVKTVAATTDRLVGTALGSAALGAQVTIRVEVA